MLDKIKPVKRCQVGVGWAGHLNFEGKIKFYILNWIQFGVAYDYCRLTEQGEGAGNVDDL